MMAESFLGNFKPTAIVLDDHKLFADAFALILENTLIFDNVVVYQKEEDLMQHLIKFRTSKQPFLFLDYYLDGKPVTLILNSIKKIRKDAYIIIVSSITNPLMIRQLLEFQPDGIISKSDGMNEILDCIYALKKQVQYISPNTQNMISSFADDKRTMPLSNREVEILRYFAQGLTVDATAALMNLSRHTIAAHRRKMFEKVKVNNIAELLAYARKIELL